MLEEEKILAGRQAVDNYRTSHLLIYEGPWHKEVPDEHTPLQATLVAELEDQGFTSTHTSFENKEVEILAKFWADSDLLNIQELGFEDWADFEANATEYDRQALKEKWH